MRARIETGRWAVRRPRVMSPAHTRARIETGRRGGRVLRCSVAAHTRARIETPAGYADGQDTGRSRTRGRSFNCPHEARIVRSPAIHVRLAAALKCSLQSPRWPVFPAPPPGCNKKQNAPFRWSRVRSTHRLLASTPPASIYRAPDEGSRLRRDATRMIHMEDRRALHNYGHAQ